MSKQRRFTKEFEAEAVRLVETSGRTQREIAAGMAYDLSGPSCLVKLNPAPRQRAGFWQGRISKRLS